MSEEDKCYICFKSEGILKRLCENLTCTARVHTQCFQKYYNTLSFKNKENIKCVCKSNIIKIPKFSVNRCKTNFSNIAKILYGISIFIIEFWLLFSLLLGLNPFTILNEKILSPHDRVSEDVEISIGLNNFIIGVTYIIFVVNFMFSLIHEKNGERGCCCFNWEYVIKYGSLHSMLLYCISNISFILFSHFVGYVTMNIFNITVKPEYNIYYNPLNPIIGFASLSILSLVGFILFFICYIFLKDFIPSFYEYDFGEDITSTIKND